MKKEKELPFVAAVALVLIGILSAITFVGGSFEAFERGACEYRSIAGYFPGRAIGCELFRKRWP